MALRLLAVAVALLTFASPAAAATKRAKAERALERVREARGEQVTPALRELFRRRAALSAADRRRADRYFARPGDPGDPDGDAELGADYTVPEADPLCRGNLCIHYVATTEDAPELDDADADTVPDYVERVLEVFEEVVATENGMLGWPPPPDDAKGGGPELDVYLADIGDQGIYGYASPDAQQPDDGKLTAYQVMDDDYAELGGDEALRVTAAHEYNHVLQFGINADLLGDWAFEATATWMEEQVYPAIEDYFQYIPPWAGSVGLPLTTFQERGTYQYGSAVWNLYLSTRFGPQVVRDAWTTSARSEDALGAYDRVVPGGFAAAFGDFTAATAEWKADPATFPDGPRYLAEPVRSGQIAVDGAAVGRTLAHASFSLLDVTARGGAPIRLEATFPEGVNGQIALVGGPAPLKRAVAAAGAGGVASVDLEDPGAYQRVTAVLTNADGRFDDVEVNARVITRPPPPPGGGGVTPPAPTPTPTPTPAPPVTDTTGPVVVIPSANRSLRASRSGVVRFGLGPMQESTSGVVSLKTDNRVRVGGRRRVLSFGTRTFQALAGQRVAARIRLGRTARRLLRARRKLRIQATLTVRDAAGNATTRTYRFTLRAPKRR